MLSILKSLLSVRFLKFSIVGASGVLVNLGFLALFADLLNMQINLASAIAIEISINTNFLMNEVWTFGDRRSGKHGFFRRWGKFHLVAFVGAALQWVVFVFMNIVWLLILEGDGASSTQVLGQGESWFAMYVIQPIVDPPDVGNLKYLSQFVGIGVAMFWNYFANLLWTWKKQDLEVHDG